MSRPHILPLPASGSISVVIMRNSVVFPAPSGPMSPNISPSLTFREISFTARSFP